MLYVRKYVIMPKPVIAITTNILQLLLLRSGECLLLFHLLV